MVNRKSALAGHYHTGHHGLANATGVSLSEVSGLQLKQVAAWPESLPDVASMLVSATGIEAAPKPNKAVAHSQVTVIRAEPLKWWVIGCDELELAEEKGTVIDQSHSRCHIRVSGDDAITLLNRHLPIDLRERSFAVGDVASTSFHHVGITFWRSNQGYELLIPRGFALSLWQLLVESAEQFGLEII